MERIDDLECNGLKIIQNPEYYCFSIDAVLLANFAGDIKGDMVIDLGTGTGVIPLLLSAKTKAKKIVGIEIQKHLSDMAERSVKLNGLEDRIRIYNMDLKQAPLNFGPESFDAVVTNPPYIEKGAGFINKTSSKAVAKHEIKCSLDDVLLAACKLLKLKGNFYMIHRASRLSEVIAKMKTYKIEPKVLRAIQPAPDKNANLFLVKGIKGGGYGIEVMPPLVVYEKKGQYTREVLQIYGKEESST